MSYEVRKDEMVGKYVNEFVEELRLARQLRENCKKPVMPYGYPVRVWCPKHRIRVPSRIDKSTIA